MRIFRDLSFAILVGVIPAHAQARPESLLRPGVRVRYVIPHASEAFTGLLEQTNAASIVVRPDGLETSLRLGLDSLQSLEVFGGLRSAADGTGRGARAGFLIGLAAGAGSGAALLYKVEAAALA
jgi:hypothetical protein